MSRHPNGADETSSASGGPLNNPLTDNEENEKKHESLGPLQQSASGDSANPAAGEASSDDPAAAAADPNIATMSASGALNDDNNNPAIQQQQAAGALSSAADSSSPPNRQQQQQQQQQHPNSPHDDSDDTRFGGEGSGGALPQQPHQTSSLNALGSGDEKDSTNTTVDAAIMSSSSATSMSPKGSSNIEEDDDDDGTDQEVPVSNNDNDNNNVTWKPQDKQSVCEFTHTITDYSQKRDSGCKKAEYSEITVDDSGNKWRLIVYVNGNGRASNHHLSLFLQVADADDLPFGWKKAVSYVLTLEHPRGSNLSYAKRNPDKTFKLCPKAIDWGWSQFITSDRIQQEGFVQNDSLIVRASVTVKNSSVTIDAEDAELYLKCAVEEGKPDAVQLCLDQGASVNCQFKDDLYTPLHTACSASPTDPENSDGDTTKTAAASAASLEGSMKVLDLLLKKGADGNACNKWKETPLLIAANNGHKAAVEALLKHGADPSLCSEAGWSALTFAAHKGYDDIVALLLNAGAQVNCRVTEDSSTPLHKACAGSKTGHLNAVKLLLGGRADVHALNKWRETPLLTAANHGQAGAVEALLKAGADPCKCTDTGWSPLSIAAYKGHDDVVKLLLEEGAPTEEADPTLSALLQAATKGLPDTVKLLLKHDADHTVTTKKGDTALSILVEQNLIDAAVEMVTKYKASIPRCSRDRKKVQRARLLINLRLKQLQRDGVSLGSDDDGDSGYMDDANGFDSESPTIAALTDRADDSKKPKKNQKVSAEEQAKAAEEALLMELELEDAERDKQEKEANKKSAKKRKKKERERQQKKEQEEMRLAEEKAKEKERIKEQKAREAAEKAERERQAAARKKEEQEQGRKQEEVIRKQQKEEERRKKLVKDKEAEDRKKTMQKQKQSEKTKNGQQAKGKGPWNTSAVKGQSPPTAKAVARTQAVATPVKPAAATKKRGWESLPSAAIANKSSPSNGKASPSTQAGKAGSSSNSRASASKPNGPLTANTAPTPIGEPSRSEPSQSATPTSTSPAAISVGNVPSPSHNAVWSLEPPAVAIFRREKISELLHRCSTAHMSNDPLGFIEESVLRKVLYRWIIRAAHDASEYIDFIIPSWVDLTKLTTFFQRQFISESRRENGGRSMMGMESLKEAGTTMATLCHTLATSVAVFRQQVEQQVSSRWNDAGVGMAASELIQSLGNPGILIDWAKRSQILVPSLVFAKLKEMHSLPQSRLLSSIFVAKICYDTISMMTGDSLMDFRLLPATKSKLSLYLSVSAEIWSDPFTSLSGNKFWGQYAELDKAFSGLKPFGNIDENDQFLADQGGSVLVVAPPDNMLATRYIRRIVDTMQSSESVPLSFAVFLRADCLVGATDPPSIKDLYSLDSRLSDNAGLLSLVEPLVGGGHVYFNEQLGGAKPSASGSLFVLLQNAQGRARYPLSNAGLSEVLDSMKTEIPRQYDRNLGPALSYSSSAEMTGVNDLMFMPQNAYVEPPTTIPASPMAQQHAVSTDFGAIGRTAPAIPTSFAPHPSPGGQRRTGPRRGRLFDLVDDDGGEEDNMNDVVSGMLGTLNVDLFQNTGVQDVDIEAISLMGIGGSNGQSNNLQPRSSRHHFG